MTNDWISRNQNDSSPKQNAMPNWITADIASAGSPIHSRHGSEGSVRYSCRNGIASASGTSTSSPEMVRAETKSVNRYAK